MGDFFFFKLVAFSENINFKTRFALEISKKQRLKIEYMLKSFVSSNPFLCWYWQI